MGGGFGGKESQATQWAALAALAARDRPAVQDPARPRRRHDHDRQAARLPRRLRAGFDDDGRILGVDVVCARCGYSADLSLGVNDRAMFHADNAYFYPAVRILPRALRTNTVSNTAFRGFGGPQGMLVRRADDGQIAYAPAAIRSMSASATSTAASAATSRPTA
jgi:xanthine dehydrogenase large subunit